MKLLIFVIIAVIAVGLLSSTITLGVLYNKSQNEASALKKKIEEISGSQGEKCPPIKPEPEPLPMCKFVSYRDNELLSFKRMIKNYVDNNIVNLVPLFRSFNDTSLNVTEGKAELAQRIVDFNLLKTTKLNLFGCISEPEFPNVITQGSSESITKNIGETATYINANWVDILPYEDTKNLYGSNNIFCFDIDKFYEEKIMNIYNLVYHWVQLSKNRDSELLPKINGKDLFDFHESRKEYREHLEQLENFLKLQDGLELYCGIGLSIDGSVNTETSVFTEEIVTRRTFLRDQANREYSPV